MIILETPVDYTVKSSAYGRDESHRKGHRRTKLITGNNADGLVTSLLLATTNEQGSQVTLQLFANYHPPSTIPTISLTTAQLDQLVEFVESSKILGALR